MKKLYIVANWKSFKTIQETEDWFNSIGQYLQQTSNETEKEVIINAPFVYLPLAKTMIEKTGLPLQLGAQDISPFNEGAYTGEVNGKQLKEFCQYVIIGHSERRQNFGEAEALLEKKVQMAVENGLTPIYCVQGKETPVPAQVTIVAYEPVSAIGSGNPDTPENAEAVAQVIAEKPGIEYVLYGGSVSPDNVYSFTSQEHISGVLVGGASLKPEYFSGIITNSGK